MDRKQDIYRLFIVHWVLIHFIIKAKFMTRYLPHKAWFMLKTSIAVLKMKNMLKVIIKAYFETLCYDSKFELLT